MLRHTISFRHALTGIWTALSTQVNLRIHFTIASLILLASVYFRVSIFDILVLVLTIMVVMLAEMVNTSIEFVCDAITLEHKEEIKHAKDVAAGAVLLSAIFAVIIAFMVFIPKIWPL